MDKKLSMAIKYWEHFAPILKQPKNKKEFEQMVSQLDELLEIVGDDENHSLMGLIDLMSSFVTAYEQKYLKTNRGKGINALKFLMQAHNLKQSDFPEIASQGVMSEILNGKRLLNLRQIKLLAKRFNVDPETFIDKE